MTITNEAPEAKRARLFAELCELDERVGDRDMTEGEATRHRSLVAGITAIDTAMKAREATIENLRADLAAGSVVSVTGDGAAAMNRGVNVNRGVDPWDGTSLDRLSDGALRDRALAAVERSNLDDIADSAALDRVTALFDDPDEASLATRWAIAASDPAYARAFRRMTRDPQAGHLECDAQELAAYREAKKVQRLLETGGQRASLLEGSGTGGLMVPTHLDPTIILTNAGNYPGVRAIARVVTTTTNEWNGISSAGVTAEWLAEATQVADATPTLAQPSIPVFKGSAYLQASLEHWQDTAFDTEVGGLIADAKARLEATAFEIGNGTTQPRGIVTALQAVTASRIAGSSGAAGAATFVIGDVYALDDALEARFQPNARWLAAKPIFNKARRFGEGTTGSNSAYWADLGAGVPSLLLGHPTQLATAMDSAIVSGSNDDALILGDFRHYIVVDRVGTTIQFNPMVMGANNRPTGEVGWFAHWRTGGDIVDPTTATAWRMLRL